MLFCWRHYSVSSILLDESWWSIHLGILPVTVADGKGENSDPAVVQKPFTDMYSTHISFIKASPIATYDIIRGKNYNLTMYLKEKKLEIFVSSISDSPKHLY